MKLYYLGVILVFINTLQGGETSETYSETW